MIGDTTVAEHNGTGVAKVSHFLLFVLLYLRAINLMTISKRLICILLVEVMHLRNRQLAIATT